MKARRVAGRMGFLNSVGLRRRLKRVEDAFCVGDDDEWIDIVMWEGSKGGIFGYAHIRISKFTGEHELTACTEEEEMKLMREHYEEANGKLYGRGEAVPFSVFLENFYYVGPPEFADRRREIIERLRSEEDAERS
jgi:hypothetical protein